MKACVTPSTTNVTWSAAPNISTLLPSYQPKFRVTGGTTWIPFGPPIAERSVSRDAYGSLSNLTNYDWDVDATINMGSQISVSGGSTRRIHLETELPRLRDCEFFVALRAPTGRGGIDKSMIKHRAEVQELVRNVGSVKVGIYLRRLRLLREMLPTIATVGRLSRLLLSAIRSGSN